MKIPTFPKRSWSQWKAWAWIKLYAFVKFVRCFYLDRDYVLGTESFIERVLARWRADLAPKPVTFMGQSWNRAVSNPPQKKSAAAHLTAQLDALVATYGKMCRDFPVAANMLAFSNDELWLDKDASKNDQSIAKTLWVIRNNIADVRGLIKAANKATEPAMTPKDLAGHEINETRADISFATLQMGERNRSAGLTADLTSVMMAEADRHSKRIATEKVSAGIESKLNEAKADIARIEAAQANEPAPEVLSDEEVDRLAVGQPDEPQGCAEEPIRLYADIYTEEQRKQIMAAFDAAFNKPAKKAPAKRATKKRVRRGRKSSKR